MIHYINIIDYLSVLKRIGSLNYLTWRFMHNIIVSAASPRVREQEQRGSSPCGQALNAAASRNRVKLYGCSVLCARTRFRKARYRQKNKMKSRAKTRTRGFIGLHSFRYFFGIHTFSQRAFYPFLPSPNSNFRFLRSHLFRGGFEGANLLAQ